MIKLKNMEKRWKKRVIIIKLIPVGELMLYKCAFKKKHHKPNGNTCKRVCVCVTFKDWGPVLIPYFLTTDVCVWHSQQTNWWLPFYLSAYFPHSNCPICALGPNSLASWSFTNWWHKGSGEALLVLYNVLQHLNIRPVLIYNNTIRLRNSFANNIEKKKENPDVNLCWEKAAVSLLLALFPWGTPLRSCEQFPHH